MRVVWQCEMCRKIESKRHLSNQRLHLPHSTFPYSICMRNELTAAHSKSFRDRKPTTLKYIKLHQIQFHPWIARNQLFSFPFQLVKKVEVNALINDQRNR